MLDRLYFVYLPYRKGDFLKVLQFSHFVEGILSCNVKENLTWSYIKQAKITQKKALKYKELEPEIN